MTDIPFKVNVHYKYTPTPKQLKYELILTLSITVVTAFIGYILIWIIPKSVFEEFIYGFVFITLYVIILVQVLPRFVEKYIKE